MLMCVRTHKCLYLPFHSTFEIKIDLKMVSTRFQLCSNCSKGSTDSLRKVISKANLNIHAFRLI